MKNIIFLFIILLLISIMPVSDSFSINPDQAMLGMSLKHPLGTDNLGRDILQLIKFGAKRTAQTVVIASLTAMIPGLILGFISGYMSGIASELIVLFSNFGLILPSFIAGLIISSFFGFNPISIGLSLGIFDMSYYVIQVSSLTKKIRQEDFVKMSENLGLSDFKIFRLHILNHVFAPVSVLFAAKASSVILRYASLAFLGLGADLTKPDLGMLIYEYRIYFLYRPQLLLWPCLGIFIFCLLFHLSFDKIDPYLRKSI